MKNRTNKQSRRTRSKVCFVAEKNIDQTTLLTTRCKARQIDDYRKNSLKLRVIKICHINNYCFHILKCLIEHCKVTHLF